MPSHPRTGDERPGGTLRLATLLAADWAVWSYVAWSAATI